MTEREKLLERMGKIKALAQRGENGEKESAEKRLSALMQKYGITDADLEDGQIKMYWIPYKTEWDRKLIHQLAYKHLGTGHAFGCVGANTNRKRKKVGVECTATKYIEIEADFHFYSNALQEEMELFYTAFLDKNNLYPPPELARKPTEDEKERRSDLERQEKISQMAKGIETRNRRQQLPAAE